MKPEAFLGHLLPSSPLNVVTHFCIIITCNFHLAEYVVKSFLDRNYYNSPANKYELTEEFIIKIFQLNIYQSIIGCLCYVDYTIKACISVVKFAPFEDSMKLLTPVCHTSVLYLQKYNMLLGPHDMLPSILISPVDSGISKLVRKCYG